MPKVSVIIPTYNCSRYIGAALQSVLDQDFQDFEIFVVDDGSTDNTREIVKFITDCRLKYLYQENKGPASARNTGINASDSKYLAFLDADDVFLSHKLATQVAAMEEEPNLGLLAGGYYRVDENGELHSAFIPSSLYSRLNLLTLVHACPIVPNAVLVRRDWVVRVGLFDEQLRPQEDWDLWLRLALEGCRMAWDDRIVSIYRFHRKNISRNGELMFEHAFRVLDKLYSQPRLPSEVLSAKNAAYASRYINRAIHFYITKDFSKAKRGVISSTELNPKLLEGKPAEIIYTICNWVYHSPLILDRYQYLRDVQENFPMILPNPESHFRKFTAEVKIAEAFESHEENNYHQTRIALLKGLLLDPSWLRNLGIWSIGLEAVLGHRVAGWLRQQYKIAIGR